MNFHIRMLFIYRCVVFVGCHLNHAVQASSILVMIALLCGGSAATPCICSAS